MNFNKLTSIISILLLTLTVSSQSLPSQYELTYEFLGKVSLQGENSKDVVIKVFEGNNWFSEYETRSNGKFAFYGEKGKFFILQFEKKGYLTKQVIVNTNDIALTEQEIGKFKFDVNLQKTASGQSENQYINKVDIVEVNNSGKRFGYKVNRDKNTYLASQNNQMVAKR